jgi:hypothetical protein
LGSHFVKQSTDTERHSKDAIRVCDLETMAVFSLRGVNWRCKMQILFDQLELIAKDQS